MICEAFIICWNESETIGFTIDHYEKFCDRITIYDNYSTDNSVSIAKSRGCRVIKFGTPGILDDSEYLKIKNHCYKDSKAKWVIVCDADEILWHPEIERVLSESKGTLFNTIGWEVYSHEMPSKSFLELQRGIPNDDYSKRVIFSPSIDINYVYGCHIAKPAGPIEPCKEQLTLFHYRNIGGPERLCERHKIYRERMSQHNKRWELGVHYLQQDWQRIQEWHEKHQISIPYDLYDPKGLDQVAF